MLRPPIHGGISENHYHIPGILAFLDHRVVGETNHVTDVSAPWFVFLFFVARGRLGLGRRFVRLLRRGVAVLLCPRCRAQPKPQTQQPVK